MLVVPVLMFLVLVAVQLAMWASAAQTVHFAASQGDAAARAAGGTIGQGVATARGVLAAKGSDVASASVQIVVLPGGLDRATVSGRAVSIVPGLSLPVTATVVGPVQTFRPGE